MCGICGELSFERDRPVAAPALRAMADRLVHRGPDHGATWVSPDGAAGLGFRRLSIIDLSASAHQPIGNEDGTIQLVFNGEIYNFREIRARLEAGGHVFRSRADSEVIVHLYEEQGDRVVDALDGMFAFALWDARQGRLLLARDRAGKKPLFVWQDSRRLVFASEIKALMAHPGVDIQIDDSAIPSYFLYGYVPHPATPYRGVTQVEPGTVAVIERDGRRTDRRYWQWTFPDAHEPRPAVTRADAARRVRELVTAAVERRLVSDVPLGAFLSGGLDSTIVVGVMSRLLERPVRTFSIGFEGEAEFDETSIAAETARRFGAEHTEFRVTPSAVDLIDRLVYHHDGPFADSSAIPTFLVAKLTREHVTVALTGDGGDEGFAGYLRFGAALAAERVPRWLAEAGHAVFGALPSPPHERHWIARGRRFTRYSRLPLDDRLTAWAGVFYDDLDRVLSPDVLSRVPALDRRRHLGNLAGAAGATPLSRLLAANFHSYLLDDLLVKADRMTMANALEARSPLLDRELLEFAATLPDEWKLDGRTTKAILREAFADLVPDAVMRGPKRGFGVPLDGWFRGDLLPMVRETLLASGARSRAYLSSAYVSQLVDEHVSQRANHGHRLWTLLTFERWLQLLPGWRASGSR